MKRIVTTRSSPQSSLLRQLLRSVIIVMIALLLLIIIFWMIDLAPLMIFLGVGTLYVLLSSKKVVQKPSETSFDGADLPDK